MTSHPAGTVTFLFTDIEGSTKLSESYPDRWDDLRKRHDAILQAAIDANHGYVFNIVGDAFCAAFATGSSVPAGWAKIKFRFSYCGLMM